MIQIYRGGTVRVNSTCGGEALFDNTPEIGSNRAGLYQPACHMTKILSLLIVAAMILHLIRPLGLPGLRQRRDFWKLAVIALLAIAATVGLSHLRG